MLVAGGLSASLPRLGPVCLVDLTSSQPYGELGFQGSDGLLIRRVGGVRFGEERLELEGGELCVDACSVLDGLRTNTEAKGGEGFGLVVGGGGAVDDESRPAVPSE